LLGVQRHPGTEGTAADREALLGACLTHVETDRRRRPEVAPVKARTCCAALT
jgi:hypothetical protein